MKKEKIFVSILAVLANILLAIGKIITGFISGSGAIFADGINSGTDVFSSIISFIGIKAAEKPADREHPYGHGKAEVISGFLITIIIFISGLFIVYEAVRELINPSPLTIGVLGFIVMASSALINGIMSQVKIWAGKKHDSVSLISDGVHSRIDLLVSLGIFIGLFLTKFSQRIDAILALLVGLYILKESFELGKETTDSLLGTSDPETEEKIKKIIDAEITNLKTQKIGNKTFAEIKVKLPSKLKIDEAEKEVKRLEDKLKEKIRKLNYISIQVKSHNVGRGYYNAELGGGFGWRRGRMENGEGLGPKGNCVCPECGKKVEHKRGKPCSSLKCPECNSKMKREK